MAYSFNNNCTKHYWNRTTTVKIIADGWVVYIFSNVGTDTQTDARTALICLPPTMLRDRRR